MMNSLALYVRYAIRSFIRGKSRTLFGVFCVAIGVTAVVALGVTAENFRHAVTGDARKLNRGDLAVSPGGFGFTLTEYKTFADLKHKGEITGYTPRFQDDATLRSPGSSTIATVVGVDPQVFPYYDTIRADEPSGAPLAALLSRPHSTVVSHDTLDTLHLKVGDQITINGRHGLNRSLTIAGVVPDTAVNPFFGAGFFNDFAMVDNASVVSYFHGMDVGASTVYVTTVDSAGAAKVKRELQSRLGNLATVKTVADVANDQKDQASGFDKFFRIMGLVAMVIGGIGIINSTMVAARRRTREIAVLKSLGMKGREVVLVFAIESLILALFGTIVGLMAGIGTSVVVDRVTENLSGIAIPWSLDVTPLVAGTLVGIVATVLFAYLPNVQASRARPIAALRGDLGIAIRRGPFRQMVRDLRDHPLRTTGHALRDLPMDVVRLPERPGVRTFVLTLALASTAGYLAILYTGLLSGAKAALFGVVAGIGTLVAAGVITQVFVAILSLISKLPSLGRLSIRMAFRSMGTQKRRLGSTMLALCVGMLSVGSVAILAQNMKGFTSGAIGKQIGYNAMVQSPQNSTAKGNSRDRVSALPGVLERFPGAASNSATLVGINGRDAAMLLRRGVASKKIAADTMSNLLYNFQGIEGRDARHPGGAATMVAGRGLTARDSATNHIVVNQDLTMLGVRVGSHLTFADNGRHTNFIVVGLMNSMSFNLIANNVADLRYMTQSGMTTPTSSHFSVIYLRIKDDLLKQDLATLRHSLPGSMVLDLSNFTTVINKSIDKVTLFPIIIGALALFAGAVIIANTVALAMLERRREIAVMKAVGAKRRTVIQFLLVENAIVGFLGTGAGVALAMLATAIVDKQILQISASYDWLTVGGLLALGVALAMAASALSALPASGERPMAVLRSE